METIISSEKINTGRQFEIDLVKFFAIPFMVCIHFYEQFGAYDFAHTIPDNIFRNVMEFLGGPLAAPIFMFCMGIGMKYARHNLSSDFIRRGWKLLIIGYSLNFFRQTLLQLIGMALGMKTDLDIIGGLLCVDILPFAGMAFLSIGLMKKSNLSSVRMCEIAFLLQGVGIWITKQTIKPGVFQNLLGLLVPTGKWTSFPLTLWLVYPALGMIFGEYLMQCEDKNEMYKRLMAISAVFFGVYTFGLVFIGHDIRYIYALCDDSYYHQNLISTLWIVPIILLSLGTCHFLLGNLEHTKLGSLIRYCSVNLNTTYIIQWMIIAYAVAVGILLGAQKTFSPMIIVSGGIIVTVISIGISVVIKRIFKEKLKHR